MNETPKQSKKASAPETRTGIAHVLSNEADDLRLCAEIYGRDSHEFRAMLNRQRKAVTGAGDAPETRNQLARLLERREATAIVRKRPLLNSTEVDNILLDLERVTAQRDELQRQYNQLFDASEKDLLQAKQRENELLTALTRQAQRFAAWSHLLDNGRLASEPQGVTRQSLYDANKLMHEIAQELAAEYHENQTAIAKAEGSAQ